MESRYKLRSYKAPNQSFWTPAYTKTGRLENGLIITNELQTIGGVHPQSKEDANDIARNHLIEELHVSPEDIIE